MKTIRIIGFLLPWALWISCKERQPYPSRPKVAPADLPAAETPKETLPLAVVVTPEGSYLATVRSDGSDLDVRTVPGWAYVRQDGSLVRFEVRTEVEGQRRNNGPAFAFASLIWHSPGGDRTLFPPNDRIRLDVQSLVKADPEMASAYYHQESIEPFGVLGPVFSWLVKVRGFTGGAHDYAETSLLVTDAERGGAMDLGERFQGRNVKNEVMKTVPPDECVRNFAGVAGLEGVGGEPTYVALLVHEYEVCRGLFRSVRVESSTEPSASPGPKNVHLDKGILVVDDGDLRVVGVVDYRASPDGRAVVMMMGLGPGDRPSFPLSDRSRTPKSREIRLWVRGGPSPMLLGRGTRILAVQFLMDHPARFAILEAFTRL